MSHDHTVSAPRKLDSDESAELVTGSERLEESRAGLRAECGAPATHSEEELAPTHARYRRRRAALRKRWRARLVRLLALAPSARPEARQRGPAVAPYASQPLGLGLPPSERLRLLGLPLPATPLPGRLVVALGAPGAEAVSTAGIGAELRACLLVPALTASLRHSGFFSLSLAENWRGASGIAL